MMSGNRKLLKNIKAIRKLDRRVYKYPAAYRMKSLPKRDIRDSDRVIVFNSFQLKVRGVKAGRGFINPFGKITISGASFS